MKKVLIALITTFIILVALPGESHASYTNDTGADKTIYLPIDFSRQLLSIRIFGTGELSHLEYLNEFGEREPSFGYAGGTSKLPYENGSFNAATSPGFIKMTLKNNTTVTSVTGTTRYDFQGNARDHYSDFILENPFKPEPEPEDYSGGLLDGKLLNVGYNINESNTLQDVVTDNNTTTGMNMDSNSSRTYKGNVVWYRFESPQNINKVKADLSNGSSINTHIIFYDEFDEQIDIKGFTSESINEFYSPILENVWKVALINNSTSNRVLFEFNVYGDSQEPIPDTTPPGSPTGLTATPGETTVDLSWTANNEPDLAGYNVYRDGVKVNNSLVTVNSYIDTGLISDTEYSYTITAIDTNDNESAPSAAAIVTTTPGEPEPPPDTTPPDAPTGLQATPGAHGRVSLSWTANSDPDLAGYNIYIDGSLKGTAGASATSYTVTDLVYGQNYDFFITALDFSGNESPPSNTVSGSPSSPSNAIGFGDSLPFSVGDMFKTAVSFLTMYGQWVLLALGVIFAPTLYGLAMKLVRAIGTDKDRKEWIMRERNRRLYWRSEEGKARLEESARRAGYSKADIDRMNREDREQRRRDRDREVQRSSDGVRARMIFGRVTATTRDIDSFNQRSLRLNRSYRPSRPGRA